MNRIKVWVFALAVVALGAVTLRAHAARLRARELAALDARLAAAAAHVELSARALARDVGAAAALAARDARLVEALHGAEAPPAPAPRGKRAKPSPPPPPADGDAREAALRDAAGVALAGATKALGLELRGATVIPAATGGLLPRKGEATETDEPTALLRAAAGGEAQRGWVRAGGVLSYAASAPAGEGAGLVVVVPVDEAWVKRVGGEAGADLTVAAPEVKPLTSARPQDAQALSKWTPVAGAAATVGAISKVAPAIGPVKVPAVPALLGGVPAHRARALALDGLKGGFLVASVAVGPALQPVLSFEWVAAAALALVLLVGVVLGLFVRSSEAPPVVPEELLEAAARIERGDFAARAPALAGKLGTVAAALNRAAELAGPAAAAATARASVTDEFYARQVSPAPAAPAEEPPTPGPFDAVPAAPRPAAAPAIAAPATAAPAAAVPELLQSAARAAAPATVEVDEEAHWQQVFQDFLRTRSSCGETSDGLTYERFRVKLESNKAALAAKYGCKTVKFQVYVKEGKAALKATPVK